MDLTDEDRHFLREDHTVRHYNMNGRLTAQSYRHVCFCGWRTPRTTDGHVTLQAFKGHLADPSAPEDERVDL